MNATSDQKSVLLLTRNFPPLIGGMERLNLNIATAVSERTGLHLVGPPGSSDFAPDSITKNEVPIRPLWIFGVRMLMAAAYVAFIRRPDIVLGGSGLVAPFVKVASILCGARSILYLHGLDIVAPSMAYRAFWLPMIRRCDLAIANSEHTRRLAIAHGLAPARIQVLNPGVSLPDISPEMTSDDRWRAERGLSDRLVLLSVGRLTQRKGLVEFIRDVLPRLVELDSRTMLVIVGSEAKDALNVNWSSETQRIRSTVTATGMTAHVRFEGGCDDATLARIYLAADVHVFPVVELPGDVEGFGMVALEAAAHGLPTVAYSVGGVSDAVQQGVSGHLVTPGDYEGMRDAIRAVLATGVRGSMGPGCRAFAENKTWIAFGRHLAELLELKDA